jgi:murein DD-endopeptidase MepM/ murein hydrolase activator NlpD
MPRRPTLRQVAIAAALAEVLLLLALLVYLAASNRVLVVRFATRESLERSGPGRLAIPVAGVRAADLKDSWGDARSGGRPHRGIDIFAARGTPVIATAAAIVVRRDSGGAGGRELYLRDLDGRTVYYHAHLDRYRGGLKEGDLVHPGETIAYVGETGNASRAHLHFGIFTVTDPNSTRGARDLNPYPLLRPADGRGGAGP